MQYFESHAHYEDEKFDQDRDTILKEIYDFGVTKCINIGTSVETNLKSIELANKYDYIYASIGIHPEEINENTYKEDIDNLRKLIKENKKIVAIGEIGLDYYWNKENKELQKEVFTKQIELANELNLPIIIHTRDAIQDMVDIIRSGIFKVKAVLHCCPFNIELVKAGLENNFYIAFGGTCTFKNSKNADEIINKVPIENILIETDSPYLSPEPKRGTRNDSRNLEYVVKKISQVKGLTCEKVAEVTFDNAKKFFSIDE